MKSCFVSIVAACVVTACAQPDRLGNSAPIDPRRASPAVSLELVPLAPIRLEGHANYDEWETSVLQRRGGNSAFNVLKRALVQGGHFLLMRAIQLPYRSDFPVTEAQGNPLASRLTSLIKDLPEFAAAKRERLLPDLKYTVGYASWRILRGPITMPDLPLDPDRRDIIDTIRKNWGVIIARFPDWKGPFGVDVPELKKILVGLEATADRTQPSLAPKPGEIREGTSAEVFEGIARHYRLAGGPAPWEQRRADFYQHLMPFMDKYELEGFKKACPSIDEALKEVPDLVALGDAYAHCALDRNNPYSAIEHLRRLLGVRKVAGYPSVLVRLRSLARHDSRLQEATEVLEKELARVATDEPAWGSRTGLRVWFARSSK